MYNLLFFSLFLSLWICRLNSQNRNVVFLLFAEDFGCVFFLRLLVFRSFVCVFSFIYSGKGEQSDHLNLVSTRQMYVCVGICMYEMINDTASREMSAHFEKTINIERTENKARKNERKKLIRSGPPGCKRERKKEE